MTKLFILHPEVAGGLGPATVISNRPRLNLDEEIVPKVLELEYRFDGWLGDEILESFPCFIVTEALAQTLSSASVLGLHFGHVYVTKSEQFEEMSSSVALPQFRRLIPAGQVDLGTDRVVYAWSGHDLCLTSRSELVVTETALDAMRRHQLSNCDIVELKVQIPDA
jgi:hypothetical protein